MARAAERPEITVLGTTTLKDLGVSLELDPLNLSADKLTFLDATYSNAEVSTHLVVVHHPFAGEHLAHFANWLSPFDVYGKHGALADFKMPVKAMNQIKQGQQRTGQRYHEVDLHLDHGEDPNIKDSYNQFVADHLQPIARSYRHQSADPVFYQTQTVRFIESPERFYEKFAEDVRLLTSDTNDTEGINHLGYVLNYGYLDGEPFLHFVEAELGLRDMMTSSNRFWRFDLEDKRSLLQKFTSRLNKTGWEGVTLAAAEKTNRTLIDLSTNRIFRRNWSDVWGPKQQPDLTLLNGNEVLIDTPNGASAKVIPEGGVEKYGYIGNKIIEAHFPPDYLRVAKYPVLGIETTTHGRRVLSQAEMTGLLRRKYRSSSWADANLGTLFLAGASPKVTKGWEKELRVVSEIHNREQAINGAQVYVWVGIEEYAKQLLSSDNEVTNTLLGPIPAR